MGDFLKKDVETPLHGCYLAAGIRLRIETNSEAVLGIARANFERFDEGLARNEDVRLKLWVEDEDSLNLDSRPYFRGLGDLVFSGYDERSSILIDLKDKRAAGRLTRTLAEDSRYWRSVLLPSLLAIIGPSVGLTSLHCACVSWEGSGLLLAGDSGAGKSTLSLALAQTGFDFLSDDRTLLRSSKEGLVAWGLSREMKQRRNAVNHFPQLSGAQFREMWTGDPGFRFDPVELLGVTRTSSCEPSWIVFLERQQEPTFALEEMPSGEAVLRLQRDLHQESTEGAKRQRETVEALSRKSCFRLRYGGNPHTVAGALRKLFIGLDPARRDSKRSTVVSHVAAPPVDPLRRFRATCLRSDVLLMGKHVRIETDSPIVDGRIAKIFRHSEPSSSGSPRVLWRIVSERRKESGASWPVMTGFCDGTLRYINLGQHSFAAADLESREAVGVLPESLCEDEIGFSTVFLASLLHLTAPALGLTPISAACVARGRDGLLLFGPPNSGKTTASYWGKKLGLEFHSDQATFLELDSGCVHAWGEFWPAAFRPETAEFIPELTRVARPFTYRDRTFLCVDKSALSGANRGRVMPVACIFLERQAAAHPRLIPLPHWQMPQQVFTDAGSEEDRAAILSLLGRVPAYRLLYNDDPSIAARFFRSVLDAHHLMEQRV